MAFVQLQVISHYSLLQTTTSLEDLVKSAKERGYNSIALTDINYMYGQIDFFKLCIKHKLKPLIGIQLDIPGIVNTEQEFSLVLLAKNLRGYQKLMTLSTIRSTGNKATLKEHFEMGMEDVIAITPGEKGEIEAFIKKNELQKAEEVALYWKQVFADQHFYLGIQAHQQMESLIKPLSNLAAKTGIPTTAMHDVRYLNPSDYFSTKVLQAIDKGEQLDIQEGNLVGGYFLPEAHDAAKRFAELGLENEAKQTQTIANSINIDLPLNQNLLPHYPIPEGTDTAEYLRKLCYEGLAQRVPTADKHYQERLDYELSIIHEMGFDDYFLIVWDVMDYARHAKILPGAGRGSAAGSLVAFVLRITHVDPIAYNLLFERFLNKERYTLPDIDLDFPDDRRDEVLRYVHNKYGHEHVAQIITFGTLAAKMAIRDTARVFGLTTQEASEWSAAIPTQIGIRLEDAWNQSQSLQKLTQASTKNALLFETAKKIEGSPRHISTHAAGIVICEQPLMDLVPLQHREGELLLTQYPMGNIEEIGLLKMDFLGLKNLTILNDAVQLAERQTNTSIDIFSIPVDDEETMRLFRKADTNGIFQFESRGIRNVLRRLGPENLEDLVAVNALYRPGPMEQIETFINRKKGKQVIAYPHPNLEPILKVTYGVMVYQEQVMQVASELAGFTLGEADILRRAIGKKQKDALDRERNHFVEGALKNNYSIETAKQVYDYIERFANYGFNRSHSVAYSFIAYQMAYIKVHYPAAFFAALLNSVNPHSDKMEDYILDIKKQNLEITYPNINSSSWRFSLLDNKIQFGLGGIKGLRRDFVQAILAERNQAGKFQHFVQFLRRLPEKWLKTEMIMPLIGSGTLDSFGYNRATLSQSLPGMMASIAYSGNNIDLFQVLEPKYVEVQEFPASELAEMEEEYLGISLVGHPIDAYKFLYKEDNVKYLMEMEPNKTNFSMGLVREIKKIQTKKGENMAFLTLTDGSGMMNATLFPETYRAHLKLLQEGQLIILKGKLDNKRGKDKESIIIQQMTTPEEYLSKRSPKAETCYIRITSEGDELFGKLKTILKENPGKSPVILVDTIHNRKILMDQGYQFEASENVVKKIKTLFGSDNVVVK
ncbi:DNA polymerase III subunit alpha [Jeotgalibaca sp. A122]|uniref:DNA polymerase III subunit alpha n=1 Tax=Jeotgalibaca sp. A122 TaxID=3457322 RepID=UPI003FD2798C